MYRRTPISQGAEPLSKAEGVGGPRDEAGAGIASMITINRTDFGAN
jgi:hypothetical protein